MNTHWAKIKLPSEIYHILPVDDLKDHEDGLRCWCAPVVQVFPNGNTLITHNSADGREFFEQDKEVGH